MFCVSVWREQTTPHVKQTRGGTDLFTLEEKKKCDAVTAHLEVDPTALVRTNYSQKMKF